MTTEIAHLLPATPEAVPDARRAVESLGCALDEEDLNALRLVVSELVTNSIRHGDGGARAVGLRLTIDDGRARGEVMDAGPGFDPPTTPSSGRRSGWGLVLVDALADRWGVERGSGTTVWFELRLHPNSSKNGLRASSATV